MLTHLKDEDIMDIKDLEIKITKSIIKFSDTLN